MVKEHYRISNFDNYAIWITMIFLCTYGLIMIYSASSLNCLKSFNDPQYLLKRQLIFVIAGIVCCFILQFIPYSIIYKFAKLIFLGGIVNIFLLMTPLGVSSNGATRWLKVAGVQFQVAEIVKLSVIVILAYMVKRFDSQLHKIQLLMLMWILGGISATLLLFVSNDFSSSVVILAITFGITFVYTDNWKRHLLVLAMALLVACIYILYIKCNLPTADELEKVSFRVGRIAAWLAPERYSSAQGYQTLQALYAIGSGGFIGKGLGNSIQKLESIPEAQNDMIFSIICEELGAFGAGILLFLLGTLLWQICKVTMTSKDLFGSVLTTGVMLHFGIQTLINVAVNVNVIPNTGIGLPFISYGGTAVFCQLVEIGIVLSVGRASEEKVISNIGRIIKCI